MVIEKQTLTALGVSSARAGKYLADLNTLLPQHNIDTPLRVAHFLSQVLHESGRMKHTKENMNYSAEGLRITFKKYFTKAQAQTYARKPQRIGSRAYAKRMGNGNEASGDGYRFRGRGLIQLTGRSNYEKFSIWVGEDVVAAPELVSDKHAVASAVFFWETRKLNDHADLDDCRTVTKRINGGLNGLSDRMGLLLQAKELLNASDEIAVLEEPTHQVTATRLNLRSRPKVSRTTLLATLNQGTPVAKLANAEVADWFKINVVVNGRIREGFVASKHLGPLSPSAVDFAAMSFALPSFDVDAQIPAAHMKENRKDITRVRDGGRAFPLGEKGRPKRTGSKPETKASQVIDIATYLDSAASSHKRYQRKGGQTFCNIYAYDFCYLCGVYLPRVWWRPAALKEIEKDPEVKDKVKVEYGTTVRELRANDLHDWLEDYGESFGWRSVTDLDELQAAANVGEVGIIVAKRRDNGRPGHITAVVPEHGKFAAARDKSGIVLRPLESQAGSKNYRFVTKRTAWWRNERFESFAFWRHP
jgi:predicted chitinase